LHQGEESEESTMVFWVQHGVRLRRSGIANGYHCAVLAEGGGPRGWDCRWRPGGGVCRISGLPIPVNRSVHTSLPPIPEFLRKRYQWVQRMCGAGVDDYRGNGLGREPRTQRCRDPRTGMREGRHPVAPARLRSVAECVRCSITHEAETRPEPEGRADFARIVPGRSGLRAWPRRPPRRVLPNDLLDQRPMP
jgi:hypothetical protein